MTATFTCDAPAFTTVNGNVISAPNAEITDWTPKNILSRTVARLLAKGLHVQSVCGDADEWRMSADGMEHKKIWISVCADADSCEIGNVIVDIGRSWAGRTSVHIWRRRTDKTVDFDSKIGWKG